MNKFTATKGEIGPGSYYALDYTPTADSVTISTIHVSAPQAGEVDIYFGEVGQALSHILWFNLRPTAPNYTFHFPKSMLIRTNQLIRVVLINTHNAAQTMCASIGVNE